MGVGGGEVRVYILEIRPVDLEMVREVFLRKVLWVGEKRREVWIVKVELVVSAILRTMLS